MASYFDELNVSEESDTSVHEFKVDDFLQDSSNTVSNRARGLHDGSIVSAIENNITTYEDSFSENQDILLAQMISALEQQENSGKTYPTDKQFLDSLPKLDRNSLPSDELCVICGISYCSEDFVRSDDIIKLPCNHMFDQECINPWLKHNNTCPICRFELPSDDPEWIKKQKIKEHEIYKKEQESLMYD
ncbi:hypothetical protein BB560_003732 [Smittium megazygosporum]|uniref:RING-type domain-containing protein n=1 Tax=Smittium megazygosporum TaxID=133381 RepID=A0A2T9ZBB7_9FUNG|nr:hypothetical protein BB560_003732 [Smittium megazygosporum]